MSVKGCRKICLRLQGGFCNRVRAIVSGVLWAEDLGATLELFWPVEKGHMPCSLEQLIDRSSIDRLTYVHAGYLRNARQVLDEKDMRAALGVSMTEYEVHIQSYSVFHPDLANRSERGLGALRKIRIIPELIQTADSLFPFSTPHEVTGREPSSRYGVIGIHVRRTDHVKCIVASPVAAFEKAIGEELVLNPATKFCLVTDDLAVKMRFQNLYGTALFITDLPLGRMTVEQQQSGVIDFLLLHKCSKILASEGSSFSELAALRAGIELVCVK
jgi:hypothetical protein